MVSDFSNTVPLERRFWGCLGVLCTPKHPQINFRMGSKFEYAIALYREVFQLRSEAALCYTRKTVPLMGIAFQ
jgi:hypothetical protein